MCSGLISSVNLLCKVNWSFRTKVPAFSCLYYRYLRKQHASVNSGPCPHVEWTSTIWCHYELINWRINSSQHLGSLVSSWENDWWVNYCFSLESYFLHLTESRRQKIAPFVNANLTTPSNTQHNNLFKAKS